jgi:predicted  nucleic acid-binding Zn-ribbon protein
MKDQLKLLVELQRHDARIQELEQMKKVWPQKLEAMQSDLQKVEQLLSRERSQLDETEAWRKRQEDERRAEEDQLLKAKQRASQVKNVKEAMASERELQATRKMAQEREEEVVKLGGAVEVAKKSIAQHEGDLETLRQHVLDEEAAAQTKTIEIDAQIGEAKKGREEVAARVSPSVLKKYSSIKMRRGLALVPVKNGTCQGCNMNIPPQLYNILQRGDSIEVCGSCNRIIYWDKMMEDPDGKPSA